MLMASLRRVYCWVGHGPVRRSSSSGNIIMPDYNHGRVNDYRRLIQLRLRLRFRLRFRLRRRASLGL